MLPQSWRPYGGQDGEENVQRVDLQWTWQGEWCQTPETWSEQEWYFGLWRLNQNTRFFLYLLFCSSSNLLGSLYNRANKKAILKTCNIWDTDYNSDNWEHDNLYDMTIKSDTGQHSQFSIVAHNMENYIEFLDLKQIIISRLCMKMFVTSPYCDAVAPFSVASIG